jgi:endonuclease IV
VIHLTGALAAEFSRVNLDPKIKGLVTGLINGFATLSVQAILTETRIAPKLLAVENVEFPFEATRQIVDKFDLSICFDTGHLLVEYSGTEPVDEFWERHKDRILELHLNDGKIMPDGRPNDHIAIGDGSFPMDVLERIIQSGFQGPTVFELPFAEAAKSLQRIRARYSQL